MCLLFNYIKVIITIVLIIDIVTHVFTKDNKKNKDKTGVCGVKHSEGVYF